MWKEDDLGTLETGKLADLVVLDRDYMSIEADDIFNIKPLLTMVGGLFVTEKPQSSLFPPLMRYLQPSS